MRKLYTTLFALSLISTGAFAQQLSGDIRSFKGLDGAQETCVLKVRGLERAILKKEGVKRGPDLPETIITETPEGKLHKAMYGESHGYYAVSGYLADTKTDGNAIDIVEGPDGSFYIHNPFSTGLTYSWIKGSVVQGKEGAADTVVIKMPQKMMKIEDGKGGFTSYYAQSISMSEDEDGELNYAVNEADNEVKFTWKNDTLCKLGKEIFGLTTAEGKWIGYGDDSILVYNIKDVPTTVPATATEAKYAIEYDISAKEKNAAVISVKKDDGNFYIGDLYDGCDFWAKGSVESDKVVLEKQYLGVDDKLNYHIFYCPAKVDSTFDELFGRYNISATFTDRLEYDYDAASGLLSTKGSFILNPGFKTPTTEKLFTGTSLSPWEDKSYMPSKPVVTRFMSYDEEYGYGAIQFDIDYHDVDGHIQNTAELYYKVYFDDNLFTFTPEQYNGLTENMTEIPYGFYDQYYDFRAEGKSHTIFFLTNDFSSIGLQTVYKGGGKTTESDITKYVPAGIQNGMAAASHPVSTIVTDLSGRRVTAPDKGLFIKTSVYADGSVKTVKILK